MNRSHAHLLVAVFVLLVAVPVIGLAQDGGPGAPGAEIDPALLGALVEDGASADFFVFMAEQADLSQAQRVADWQARGRYVYDTLRQTAERSQAPVLAYARDHGLAARSFLSNNAVYISGGGRAAVEELARLPGVARLRLPERASLQPDRQPAPASPNSYGWNLDTLDPTADLFGMQAAQVWQQYGITGQGIVVANIDTGAFYEHVALDRQYRGNLTGAIGGPYEHDYNWYQPNYKPCGNGTYPCDSDYYGHGTGTIGLMVGETPNLSEQIGVAPGARWIACMGCDDPPYCTEEALVGCADWMLAPCAIGDDPGDASCNPDLRPHVVNNSWGGGGCDTWYQPSVEAWVASGIFPAFAAGNAGGCGTVASPGDLPAAFGVAAHWTDGVNAYAGGPSCFFPAPTCDPAAHDIDPHVNAPTGGETAGPEQATYSALGGTSGATPHVAGVVALLWAANPGLIGQIDATYTILEQSANRDLPAPYCGKPACAGTNGYPNYDFGWGYLDALAAVQMAGAGALGTLQGSVVEATALDAPGDPLPDVTITAQRLDSVYPLQGKTGAAGAYTLTLPAGVYTVTADGPRHGPAAVSGVDVPSHTISTLDFQLLPKGLLVGYVTDVKSGAPLAASVGAVGVEPVDTDPLSGYYSIYLGQGSQEVVAEASNYASQTMTLDIVSGQQLQQDFALTPALDLAPQPIEASVDLFASLDLTTVITNQTAAIYNYWLSHEASRAGDEGPILLVDGDVLEENADAFDIALTHLGYDHVRLTGSDFYSLTIPELLNYAAVIYAGNPAAGAPQEQIMAYLDAGGRFLLADGSFTLYHQDSRLHKVYLQAIYDGLEEWAGPQIGLDIMSGLSPDISSAIVVYDSYAGPEGIGIFQAPGSHLTGIRTERAGYRAIFLSFDLNRIGAREPGDAVETDVVYPAMLWLLGYPVQDPWYSTSVSGGTVPAYGSGSWSNEFSATPAAGIDQPGEFYARLHVEPAAVGQSYPRLDVPVHLTVLPRSSMGKIAGLVTTDRPGGPIQTDVLIEGAGGTSWTVKSDWWTGGYSYWLEAGDYTLSVSADGYYSQTAQVTVGAGLTVTQDFALVLAAPEISLAPLALDESLPFGTAVTRTLHIANVGPESLTFEVQERDRGLTPLVTSILAAGAEGVDGARILFDQYHGGEPSYYEDLFADLGSLGATVDVWSTGPITSAVLAGYDILFIGDFLDIPYGFEELDAIDAFVRQGGGLFVTYECCDDTTAPVVTALFDIIYIGRGGTGGVTHNVFPHPTTRGVGAVYLPSPQYLMTATVTGTAEIVLYDVGGDPAAAANEVGNGKVFVMPDQEFWDGVYAEADNAQFARNVFGWLYGDVAWLASDVTSATVAPGQTTTLTISLDGGAVDEPAVYYGDLIVANNDPLSPAPALPVTLTVQPTAGLGRLQGTVTSNRPGGGLPAELLVEDSAGPPLTVYSLPSSGEYHRWLPASTYTITASSAGYITQTAQVQVPDGGSAQLDFELVLDAPGVATLPTAVEQTVAWGLTATQRVTVSNVGLRDLDVTLLEEDLGQGTRAQGTQAFAFDGENERFVRFPLDAPDDWTVIASWSYQYFDGGDFRLNDFSRLYAIHGAYLYTLDTTSGEDGYVAYIGVPYPHTLDGLTIAADGTLYAVSDYWYGFPEEPHESYLWTIDPVHGTPTLIGQISNAEFIGDIAINRDGEMYGLDLEQDALVRIDPATAAGTVVGSLGFDVWSGCLDFDDDTGRLYLGTADYLSNRGYLWTVDVNSGLPTVVGGFPVGAGISFLAIAADGLVDIPWLDETPTVGTVPPGGGLGIDLAFDASGVNGPGSYRGSLHVQSNDPLQPDLPLPVTMTVVAGEGLGQVAGTVTGLGYCNAEPQPLAAEVVFESAAGLTWTASSDAADGGYSRWLPAGTYTATALVEGHSLGLAAVEVVSGGATTQDFDLYWLQPCLSLTPGTISVTVSMGTLWTETLTIANDGAENLIWSLRETTDTLVLPASTSVAQLSPHTPPSPSTPTSTSTSTSLSIEPLVSASRPAPGDAEPAPSLLFGAPAYGLDTSTFDLVHIPDTSHPNNWEVLANVGHFYSGGDFWHGDFDKLYALDFYSNEFVTLELSSGQRTVIGTAHTLPGHHWTGLTAATDGTIYGVSTECNVASALYTIDRLTGEAMLVGTTTAAPCLIDVAINAQGEMYAVDISTDALYQINPATAAATAIGLLGFDANHAQSLDFDEESGILYWAATNEYNGSLRRIDTGTGLSLHIGYFPNYTGVDCLALASGGGGPFWGDVPWVREVPTGGLTLPGESTTVDVVLDAGGLTAGQCYTAGLGLLHDDPRYVQPAIVPLSLCVTKPWPVFYLTKTVASADLLPGETTTYTLIVGNDGSLETGITISDVLPAGIDYAWSEPPGAYNAQTRALTWSGLVLDGGARLTNTIGVTLSAGLEPGTRLTNTVYLLWRDQVLSDWASLKVREEGMPSRYTYLPLVVKGSSGP